jgi:hypothetical protein
MQISLHNIAAQTKTPNHVTQDSLENPGIWKTWYTKQGCARHFSAAIQDLSSSKSPMVPVSNISIPENMRNHCQCQVSFSELHPCHLVDMKFSSLHTKQC